MHKGTSAPRAATTRTRLGHTLLAVLSIALLSVVFAACGSDDDSDSTSDTATTTETASTSKGVTALPASSCGEVEYEGAGEADVLIASDLPMNGASKGRSEQMVDAIRLVLDDADWSAGDHRVAFQACDDSLAKTGEWDEAKCKSNAEAYSGNSDVVGVVGTYNSGCAAAMLPILNEAPGGGVGLVSPGNTLVCLTEPAANCPKDEPASFAPTGKSSYVRVVPNDADQAAGLVSFAQQEGVKTPYVLFAADDPTSKGQAVAFRNVAKDLGIPPVGMQSWDPEAKDYTDLMTEVAKANPDGVVLAGLTEQNGGELIKAKVDELGPNDGDVKLLAPDGFAQQSTITEAGAASKGMYVSVPGRAPSALTGPGKELVTELGDQYDVVELYAPYAGQAAAVLLDAIEKTDGKRGPVVTSLFKTKIENGIIGSFGFHPSGDPTLNPITVFQAGKEFEPVSEIEPAEKLVAAARG